MCQCADAGESYFAKVFTGISYVHDSEHLPALIVYYHNEVNVLYSGMHMLYI